MLYAIDTVGQIIKYYFTEIFLGFKRSQFAMHQLISNSFGNRY